MKFLILAAMSAMSAAQADTVTFGSGVNEFTMEFSLVRSVGNAPQNATNRDHTASGGDGLGAVDYAYKIGTHEVTIDQFAKAQAASGNTIGNGNENYWQATLGGRAPATRVSFHEAARFCNWLTSGNATNGAYVLDDTGAVSGIDRATAIATYRRVYVLPSRDEWAKAAYYDTENEKYTLYAFGTNAAPAAGVDANYMNSVGRPWSVGSGTLEQNGTYDMMGNVWEWSEQDYLTAYYRVLGGSYQLAENYLSSSGSSYLMASDDSKYQFGFRVVELYTPPHAKWSDYLYPDDYLNGESHCPDGYLKIYVSTNGYNRSINVNNPDTPIKTLYYAKYLIDAIEAYDEANGLNRWPGYCILLKRGETFVPYDYFTLQNSQNECTNDEYNRAAFYWNINKPLYITSYGESGNRPVIDGRVGYISKVNSYGDTNKTVRIQFPFMICMPSDYGEPGWSWNQNTVIENLHIYNWELSAIWNYKNSQCEIRNNIIERIGTYYFPEEEYRLAGGGQKVEGGPIVYEWPIYAGSAIYAHRSSHVNIHNNVIKNVHNRDKNDFPLVDKLHTVYAIAAVDVEVQSNCIQRVSGPPLVVRVESHEVYIANNRLENAAPVTDVTQYWSEPYVQQGFVRIPATYGIVPYNVVIENNEFFFPYYWDIELGRSSSCAGQVALDVSGQFFDGPMDNFLMTNNTFILDWDPNW